MSKKLLSDSTLTGLTIAAGTAFVIWGFYSLEKKLKDSSNEVATSDEIKKMRKEFDELKGELQEELSEFDDTTKELAKLKEDLVGLRDELRSEFEELDETLREIREHKQKKT